MLFQKDQIPISGDFCMKGNRADCPGMLRLIWKCGALYLNWNEAMSNLWKNAESNKTG